MVSNFQELREFVVGVDLGQAHDPTAIAVIEHVRWRKHPDAVRAVMEQPGGQGWIAEWDEALRGEKFRRQYNVRHLERLPLGTHYPAQVAHIAELVRRAPLKDAPVFYDYTGVGRAVGDLLHDARIPRLHRVHLTGGQDSKDKGTRHAVSKTDLVSRLQAVLHTGELAIEESLSDAAVLARELADYKLNFTTAGNAQFNARSGAHDDLLIATGLALYGCQSRRDAVAVPLRMASR